ncbi:hypothetical protein [Bradyrhizobium sp. CCGE-LA001]|uniref:hypothetical protein n=1 Tax=Bradyrhizobium sp. CCGE-LA001 TaxID=1223566 RepID=UPI000745D319|nr:hypothetical protein [Bradyrhizobium sp. CCGE-LA001]AMA55728.1 hypothetical protein BCCGELA001_05230 [Bradyrhizobium sp. CCGE-LA001]
MSDEDQTNGSPFGKFSMHESQQPNKTSQSDATKFTKLLLGSYSRVEADDPEVFASAVVRLFCYYPVDVVTRVCDPVFGLATKLKWFPTLAEIKSECTAVSAEFAHRERRKNLGRSIPPPVDRQGRPTMEELKAKYGPNWGIAQEEKSSGGPMNKPDCKSMTNEQLAKHYKKYGLGGLIKKSQE